MKVYFFFLLLLRSFRSVYNLPVAVDRREVFSKVSSCLSSSPFALLAIATTIPTKSTAVAATVQQQDNDKTRTSGYSVETIRVPLHYVPTLSAYVVYYSIAGERFGAIVDTGSPFLTIPDYCNKQKWGCYRPENSQPSGLERTFERFDNNQGWVEWRTAPFSFTDAATSGSLIGPTLFTFGVLSESLLDGPGGVFFGLIRDTDTWIRPSFLGQTKVQSFQVDLLAEEKSMTLSTGPGELLLLDNSETTTEDSFIDKRENDYIPLVRDLTRRFKDPVYHYVAKATSIKANGTPLLSEDFRTSNRSNKPIYVIFDTGVSGMVVTSDILNERYASARRNREKSLWGTVEIDLRTKSGNIVSLMARRPITTPFGQNPWPSFKNAHLIVLGLAFLDDHKMIVDIDQQKLWIT